MVASSPRHTPSCHTAWARLAVAAALGVAAAGCAAKQGWQVDTRGCKADTAPRVCLQAQPDAPLSLTVGQVRIVPGECASAPAGTRGGSARVTLEDGRNGTQRSRRLHVRKRGTVTVDARLRGGQTPAIKVSHARCR